MREVIDAVNALLIWGGRVSVISTHNGHLNAFNELVREATPWAPRTQTTLDAYAARRDKPGPRPLIGSTKSLSGTISYEARADDVTWGSNMIYAAVQQFGAEAGAFGARMGMNKKGRRFFMPIPWGNIPARRFLGVGKEDETALIEIVEEYLEGAAAD
ncbi:MAG: hypothetical protein GYB50_17200 [Rhodobacteraceae bacterium]|uniref:phage virion morphogenesis protein n=1 Tax=Salipiger thiooxidans TaxID=282683 RepID=UPI001A8DD0BE|nr:phage virion morphogenesis protein [Salipiger thiooxidans]MBR9839617.1 hypothetical protein [Paracoccaceae bacterium]